MHRKIPGMLSHAEVATLWFDQAYCAYEWTPNHRVRAAGGHQGGAFADCTEIRRTAYLKPRISMTSRAAACEKIASDLAHVLRVNVPPAILTNRPPWWEGDTELLVASLRMYSVQYPWGTQRHGVKIESAKAEYDEDPRDHARAALKYSSRTWAKNLAADLPAQAARALAFDTWVANPDRCHPTNTVYGTSARDPDDHSLVFLDFEKALGCGSWPDEVRPADFPPRMLALLDRGEVASAVSDIQAMSEDVIRDIVSRIPVRFITDDEQREVIQQLVDRAGRVRKALSEYLDTDGAP